MKIGIYQIRNIINNKIYIGSSKNIEKRWKCHLNKLKTNKHINIYLQKSYIKYGLNAFEFTILEECSIKDLFIKEQFWIDKLQPQYNIGSVGGGDNISKHPNLEQIRKKNSEHSKKIRDSLTIDERKARWGHPMETNPNWKGGTTKKTCLDCGGKMSQYKTRCNSCSKKGKLNPFSGKTHSDETIQKIKKANKGRHRPHAKAIIINNVEYRSQTEASKILGIHVTTISYRIRNNYPGYFIQPHQEIKLKEG